MFDWCWVFGGFVFECRIKFKVLILLGCDIYVLLKKGFGY